MKARIFTEFFGSQDEIDISEEEYQEFLELDTTERLEFLEKKFNYDSRFGLECVECSINI